MGQIWPVRLLVYLLRRRLFWPSLDQITLWPAEIVRTFHSAGVSAFAQIQLSDLACWGAAMMQIRTYEASDNDGVVHLSLRAWAPVFASIKQTLSPEVYSAFYTDWRIDQRRAVEAACSDEAIQVWVAEGDESIVGFCAARSLPDGLGEIHMLAVDPDFQRQGIATALSERAVDWMRSVGVSVAMVETGGDPGHAPARQAYEKLGFQLFPVARYFKKL